MGVIYSLLFEDRVKTETDLFFENLKSTGNPLCEEFSQHLVNMADYTGFKQDFFKLKGYPSPLGYILFRHSTLRLYSYWANESVIILGNGGIKPRSAKTIADCSLDLQDAYERVRYAGNRIRSRHDSGYLRFDDSHIKGSLLFERS